MRRLPLIIGIMLVSVALVGAYIYGTYNSQIEQEPIGGSPPIDEDLGGSGTDNNTSRPNRPTNTPTTPQKSTPTPTRTQTEQNITVTSPRAGETIDRPVTVIGQARTFEQGVNFRLKEKDGTVLAESFTTARAPDIGQFGPYDVTIDYPLPSQSEGILEVYQASAKDGSEIDKVIINVKFAGVE